MAETKTPTQIAREIAARLAAEDGSGDPTFRATQQAISQFNGGTEIIKDFSAITPTDNNSLYLENPLNGFDIYTYNISLHQVNPVNVKFLETAIENGQTVLVADNSQESKYNITSMEQIFSVGHSIVRDTFSHKFTMEVTEPNGSSFLNDLVTSAIVNLDCRNANTARYFLIIEFVGRAPNGASIRFPSKFLYPCLIQNIEMQVTGDGTKYNINLVSEGTYGYSYLENVIKGTITVEAATVGEFITEFMRKFNLMMAREADANPNQALADTYVMEFDAETGTTEWANWKIQQADAGLEQLGPSAIGDKIHFNIQNGSNVTDIVALVLRATAEYKQIQTASGGTMKAAPSVPARPETLAELPVFHKVISNVEYTLFDPRRGDWNRKITYRIKKHIVVDIPMNALQYNRAITDQQIQTRRVNNIIGAGLLRKKYDYIFTGLNTEVLNFDIKFNRAYYVMSTVNKASVGDPNVVATRAGRNAPTQEAALAAIQEQNSIPADALDIVNQRIDEISNQQLQLATARNRLVNSSRDAGGTLIEPTGDIATQIERIDEELTDLRNSMEQLLVRFSEATNNNRAGITGRRVGDFIPAEEAESEVVQQLRFARDVVDDTETYGPEADLVGGQIQFGTVKANLENSSDLMNIEIHIKGDPYWFGKPNSFFRSTRSANADTTELADYELGGPLFFLNMHLPIDENSAGRRKPRNDYRISGLYRVINVISTFEGGKFTMHLKAVRDTLTNTPTILPILLGASTTPANGTGISRTNTSVDVAQIQESGN